MKKIFKLQEENKNEQRLLEAIKNEIRKYIKREKRKPLPEDVDYWKFECKFAKEDNTPETIDFLDITKCIDEASNEKCTSFYMEILSTEGIKVKKPTVAEEIEDTETLETSNSEEASETTEA